MGFDKVEVEVYDKNSLDFGKVEEVKKSFDLN